MKTLLYWLSGRLPCRIISDDGTPYLERYYVGTLFNVRFYLQRFVGSDPALRLHGHPWAWARSIVLSGFYFEERRDGKLHEVRWFNKLSGDAFHRVVLPIIGDRIFPMQTPMRKPIEQPCWMLFFHSADYSKPWAFMKMKNSTGLANWTPLNRPGDGGGSSKPWRLRAPKGRDEPRRAGKDGAL
jgi:hypothetical protein